MLIHRQKHLNLFKYWLITSISLVVIMILVGGLTRLTNSGLSITEWEVFKGVLPPLNSNQWEIYFNKYKEIPQFYLLFPQMSLDEFKYIFYWEYFHRLLGRLIALFFLIPLIYFTFKKIVNLKILINLYAIFLLICLQGFMGWYMVKSGLADDVTVSHYRLSAHLLLAFVIISYMFWIFLNTFSKKYKFFYFFDKQTSFVDFFLILILIQIFLGALVSGLDAGKIYQTWPLMNYTYFPSDLVFNDLFDFNNQSSVQFIHRNSAYFIAVYTLFLGYKILNLGNKIYLKNFYLVAFLIFLQIALGVLTLITNLNTYLASLHQITSLLLFFSVIHLRFKMT